MEHQVEEKGEHLRSKQNDANKFATDQRPSVTDTSHVPQAAGKIADLQVICRTQTHTHSPPKRSGQHNGLRVEPLALAPLVANERPCLHAEVWRAKPPRDLANEKGTWACNEG